jgi:hypothetical protein
MEDDPCVIRLGTGLVMPCGWADRAHTVCSMPLCQAMYALEQHVIGFSPLLLQYAQRQLVELCT